MNRRLTLQQLSQFESFEQRRPRGLEAADQRALLEFAVMDRFGPVATTRSLRHAGPPPLAIDWRTSTTSTRRMGPLPATCFSIQRHTAGVSRASLGMIRVGSPPGGVTSWPLNR